jgi:hypothetical protein
MIFSASALVAISLAKSWHVESLFLFHLPATLRMQILLGSLLILSVFLSVAIFRKYFTYYFFIC